jgi:glycosyltransferase involved in cell wall biosynthesis
MDSAVSSTYLTGNLSPYKVLLIGESLDNNGGVVAVEKAMLREFKGSDFELYHIPTVVGNPGEPALHKVLFFIKSLIHLINQFIKGNVELVHLHMTERGDIVRTMLIILVCQAFHKPFILHAHGAEFHTFFEALPRIYRTLISRAFQKADFLITLSQSWKHYYTDNCNLQPEKVIVVRNPVEIPPLPLKQKGCETTVILSLGRVGKRKGSFDLIKAFSQLPTQARQSSKLVLAGDGDLKEAEALIESLNLKDNVSLTGWLDSQQRNQLLEQADIFVLPSYNEGLPLALLEAMAWSLSVITTPVGGIPEVITDQVNGLLIQPGDIEGLSLALSKLISNAELRNTLGEHARKSVQPFDVADYTKSIQNLYMYTIASRRNPRVGANSYVANKLL